MQITRADKCGSRSTSRTMVSKQEEGRQVLRRLQRSAAPALGWTLRTLPRAKASRIVRLYLYQHPRVVPPPSRNHVQSRQPTQ
jgi:hypothetical protein